MNSSFLKKQLHDCYCSLSFRVISNNFFLEEDSLKVGKDYQVKTISFFLKTIHHSKHKYQVQVKTLTQSIIFHWLRLRNSSELALP